MHRFAFIPAIFPSLSSVKLLRGFLLIVSFFFFCFLLHFTQFFFSSLRPDRHEVRCNRPGVCSNLHITSEIEQNANCSRKTILCLWSCANKQRIINQCIINRFFRGEGLIVRTRQISLRDTALRNCVVLFRWHAPV